MKPSSPLRNRCCLQHGNVLSKTCISDQFTLRQFRKSCCPFQNVLEVIIVTKWCFDVVWWIAHLETPISNYLGEIILLSVLTKIPPWHTSNSEIDLENWDCRISPPSNHWFSASGSAFKKWLVMNASEIPQEYRWGKSYSFNSLRKCIQQQLDCQNSQTQIGAQHSWNSQKRIGIVHGKTNCVCESSVCKDWTDQ